MLRIIRGDHEIVGLPFLQARHLGGRLIAKIHVSGVLAAVGAVVDGITNDICVRAGVPSKNDGLAGQNGVRETMQKQKQKKEGVTHPRGTTTSEHAGQKVREGEFYIQSQGRRSTARLFVVVAPTKTVREKDCNGTTTGYKFGINAL